MSYIAIFTTVSDEKSAKIIADKLMEENLAACISFHKINSVYKWQGSVQREHEYELCIKTKKKFYKKAEKTIKNIHTYEMPQVIAFKIKKADKNYLRWIDKSIRVK